MKHLLAALFLAALPTAVLADSAEAILKDYQQQSAAALAKLNDTLEKAGTPLIATLIKSGDAAGAEQLTEQLKSKLSGMPVITPHASAVLLFAQYDQARASAIKPAQKAALARIDAVLSGKQGQELDTVTALGKARVEIEAADNKLPVEWVYKHHPTDRVDATIWLNPGSKFVMLDRDNVTKTAGTWTRTADKGGFTMEFEGGDKWTVELKDGMGIIHRSVGLRYMLPK